MSKLSDMSDSDLHREWAGTNWSDRPAEVREEFSRREQEHHDHIKETARRRNKTVYKDSYDGT